MQDFYPHVQKKSEGPSERIALYNAKRLALNLMAQHTYHIRSPMNIINEPNTPAFKKKTELFK